MDIFIYSDESGVLDKAHNDYFVFGGLLFLSKADKDAWCNKYIRAEKVVRQKESIQAGKEVKASSISNASKGKLYRSLNAVHKFGIVISQKALTERVFASKKSKQRYLDWAFKMAIKEKFQTLINAGIIVPANVQHLFFFVDEHTTATNGLYELRESLEQEFKYGMVNYAYNTSYPPIFPKLQGVTVQYCNSANVTLVRAADIVANHIYHRATSSNGVVEEVNNLYIKYHPNR